MDREDWNVAEEESCEFRCRCNRIAIGRRSRMWRLSDCSTGRKLSVKNNPVRRLSSASPEMHKATCSRPLHPSICRTRLGRPAPSVQHFVAYSAADDQDKGGELLTVKEVQSIVERRGLWLGIESLGPGYKVECRDGDERGQVLGYTNGFIVPFASYMHCDTLFTKGAKLKDAWGGLGLGVLLGVATFAFGNENGCRKAEILAINDDEYTAQRLVRYYKYFGFQFVKEVSGTDLFDLLVWGGVGTKMSADVQHMLERWGKALRKEGFE